MINTKFINKNNYSLSQREEMLKSISHFEKLNFPHVLLSTCNRVEYYWGEGAVSSEVIDHLYRVVSGLESAIVGEKAIQGQLKLAYKTAKERYRLSSTLNQLFQRAIYTGRRVRNETMISSGAVSHSQAVVEIIKSRNYDLQNKRVTIIGINKLNVDIMKFLTRNKANNILLSNRNLEKAKDIASLFGCQAAPLSYKHTFLAETDILISATSAPHSIIYQDDIPKKCRMLIFDLAFPRDIERGVGELSNVELLNLEDIERFAKNSINVRLSEVERAEKIIDEEIERYYKWQENYFKFKDNGKN